MQLLIPSPWSAAGSYEVFPCLQAVQDTFSLAQRGNKSSSWLLSSAPHSQLVVLAVGLAWGSYAVTKITITIQVKKNTNTSSPGEGQFCFQSKTHIVPTCILAFSGKGWQTGCRNEQLHVEGSRKNVTLLPKEAYHASVWLLKLDRASPRQCARQV